MRQTYSPLRLCMIQVLILWLIHFKFLAKSGRISERADSGLYSEDNDYTYTSSCQVESKHFKNVPQTSAAFVESSYEAFVANLPLPVAEMNKSVSKSFLEFISSQRSKEQTKKCLIFAVETTNSSRHIWSWQKLGWLWGWDKVWQSVWKNGWKWGTTIR